MKLIDTHAHIYAKEFFGDVHNIIEICATKSVEKILMPNIDQTSIEEMLAIEQKYPNICYSMMGLHPTSVKKDFEKELLIVQNWLEERKFIAIGEIGIDLYWEKEFKEQQIEAFKIQVNWAKKYKIPIAIHCRAAFEETISIVEELKDESLNGVFHCFSGSVEEAERIVDLGFFLGIGGVVTFKNGGLDKVIPKVSLQNIILETDSPYLAPAPFRGKRNSPDYLPIVAQRVADLCEQKMDSVAEITTNNANKLFRLSGLN